MVIVLQIFQNKVCSVYTLQTCNSVKFDKLSDILTTALTIKRKYKKEQTIPFENCPKFSLCANHALTGGQENSYMRRQSILVIQEIKLWICFLVDLLQRE